jgi:hypothetical protein
MKRSPRKTLGLVLGGILLTWAVVVSTAFAWEPQAQVSREECIQASQKLLAQPDIKITVKEDIFRLRVVEMDWDIGVMVYQPEDPSKIPVGADGKKVGVFLLHGGDGDYRAIEPVAKILSTKFGYKVASMTFPGRLYLQDPSRKWPGDTVHPDGTVRTPIWKKDELITPDQYEVVQDKTKRERYGIRTVARAKIGTNFYHRMASWPIAFEEAMKETCKRHLPVGEYSIYCHGHSTGGPFVHMLLQRVPNIQGIIGVENSPFGHIYSVMNKQTWPDPFYELSIRSWRDSARYKGPEALGQEGPKALMRLPWLMEEVFEEWEQIKDLPQFKAEYIIHYDSQEGLTEAAKAVAKRLNMNQADTDVLIKRYCGYTRELSGPGVKPVPPLLLGVSKDSRDHNIDRYNKLLVPMFKAMNPPPRLGIVQFMAGVHGIWDPEKDLPMGIFPAVATMWNDAIMKGFYVH